MSLDDRPDYKLIEHDHLEVHEEEAWLVSYADLMTLLFGFFAMMFTYANFDEEGYVKMRKEVARYFGGAYLSGDQTTSGGPIPEVNEEIKKQVEELYRQTGKSPFLNDKELKATPDGLELSFVTNIPFLTGSAEVPKGATESLVTMVGLIKSSIVEGKRPPIVRIEGHTDDVPLASRKGSFVSNWELSAARAGAVVRLFEREGIPSESLSAIGFGSARPAFPFKDKDGKPIAENRARNRRVVIKVIQPPEPGVATVEPAREPGTQR